MVLERGAMGWEFNSNKTSMKKLALLYAVTGAFLLTLYGVVHSIARGRCVNHSHSGGWDNYVVAMAVYFILIAMAYAVYRYYVAVCRK